MIVEACVENPEEALKAQSKGAGRVELNSRLDLDGLTPVCTHIERSLNLLEIPVKVMIRPRGGHFMYNENDLIQMLADIEFCKEAGVQEVVLGATVPGGQLDLAALQRLSAAARPMNVCVHKAIDVCTDPVLEAKRLSRMDTIDAILSSGGAKTALQGAETLRQMQEAAGNAITVVAAGKITPENLHEVKVKTALTEFHGRKIVCEL